MVKNHKSNIYNRILSKNIHSMLLKSKLIELIKMILIFKLKIIIINFQNFFWISKFLKILTYLP
jgi:hypothetical protein